MVPERFIHRLCELNPGSFRFTQPRKPLREPCRYRPVEALKQNQSGKLPSKTLRYKVCTTKNVCSKMHLMTVSHNLCKNSKLEEFYKLFHLKSVPVTPESAYPSRYRWSSAHLGRGKARAFRDAGFASTEWEEKEALAMNRRQIPVS